MKIVDAHAHIGWDTNNIRNNLTPTDHSAPALLQKMDIHGIDKSIVMPFPSARAEFSSNSIWFDIENKFVTTAAATSKRLIPFLGVNPNDKGSVKDVDITSGLLPIKGVKLLHETQLKFSIENLIEHPLMKIIHDNGLIFMMHTGTGKEKQSHEYHNTLDYAVKVAKRYPDIIFIFSHLGRLHENMLDALRIENVFMDTSGLSLQPWKDFVASNDNEMFSSFSPTRIIEKLVDFGFNEKIIWGSDEPYTHHEKELSFVSGAEIPESKKKRILCDNIQGLLGLK